MSALACRRACFIGIVSWCVVGCRFGGPTEDPTQWLALAPDGAVIGPGAGDGSESGKGAGSGSAGSAGNSAAGTNAASQDASVLADTGPAPEPIDDAGMDGSECSAPSTPPAVCDPIANTGCAASMQCDVDLAAAGLAGRCTFSAPVDGGPCIAPLVTQSCPPTQTCNAGLCRTVCLCDSDCTTGERCSEALGTQGWKLCVP